MRTRFIAKKKNRFNILKVGLFVVAIYISFIVTFNVLLHTKVTDFLADEDLHEMLFDVATNQGVLNSLELLNPKDMFRLSLNYAIDASNAFTLENSVELIENHVNDPDPIIYIYNTHDTEAYDSSLLESYNIKYNVKIASYILSDYLKDLGIPSFVETESMATYLSTNGLLYQNSYEASRYYINKRLEEHPSIEMIIDLHRDSATKNATQVSIDGKSYAKVLFVVGMDYEGYETNLEIAEQLNSKLEPELRRGISKKTGAGVNGVYNQDIMDNAILLEIGGVDNTIEEVANTLEKVARMLFEFINEG